MRFIAGIFLFLPVIAFANLKSVKVSLNDKSLVAPRWIFESKPNVSEKTPGFDLYSIKNARKEKRFEDCVAQSRRALNKYSNLKAWLTTERLECSVEAFKKNKKNQRLLVDALATADQEREWLFVGPQSSRLREAWIEGQLNVFDEYIRSRRKLAWETFVRLEEMSQHLSRDRRAKLYRQAGELAFLEQKLSTAVFYFEKSLRENETSAVRQRWLAVRGEYYRSLKREPPPEPVRPVSDDDLEASADELTIYNRMRDAIKTGDYVSAVEDGIRLIREFPGSRRSQFATKQILSIYLSLAQKSDEKFLALKGRVLQQMSKADGTRLYEWAQTLVAREYFADAIVLSQTSLEQVNGHPVSTKVLLLLAQSALHLNDYANAKKYLEKLVREHSGSKQAMEAIFRLGLVHYREANYAESVSYFEKYLALKADFDYEISSLYWLWRSQQKLKNPKADDAAQELIRRYPLSYFAIRARYELNQEKLIFNDDPKGAVDYTAEIWVTPSDSQTWGRFTALLKAGWLEEAQVELRNLPEPTHGEGLVVWAWLWGQTLNYHRTFEILQQVWQKDPSLIRPSVLRVAYPQEFISNITAEANKYKIPPVMVMSLIRQESSFRPFVQSPAGARGLMQVMAVTGREIANDLRIKLPNFPDDLYQPDINIRIGTNYIQRLLKNFDGNVPLALAAYNAGIGNVRGWLSGRTDSTGIRTTQSSQVDAEIWFDELPWLETSGYIKSILRNWILYRYLEKGEVQFSDPLWRI